MESVVISSNANIRFDLRIVLLDEFRAMLVLPPRKKGLCNDQQQHIDCMDLAIKNCN